VWAAVRPNALTLAVSQGKGVDDDAAAASAMMEAIEVATAERRDLPRLALSPRRWRLRDAARRAVRTAAPRRFAAGRDEPIDWIEGFELMDGGPIWVPLDAVTLGEAAAEARYWQSTDGLASGNVLWEAAFHGLCERVERDALALWSLCDDSEVGKRCRDPRDFDDSELARSRRRSRRPDFACACSTFRPTSRSPSVSPRSRRRRRRPGALASFRLAERQRLPSRSGAPPFAP